MRLLQKGRFKESVEMSPLSLIAVCFANSVFDVLSHFVAKACLQQFRKLRFPQLLQIKGGLKRASRREAFVTERMGCHFSRIHRGWSFSNCNYIVKRPLPFLKVSV